MADNYETAIKNVTTDTSLTAEERMEALENLFKAIDIIAQERLTGLGYDKTIKATIVDDSNADKGEYIVSDGSSKFTAYSDVKYSVDTVVYVIIPQGDYDNTKLIVGKYTDKNSTYNYANPSDDFLDITHNLVQGVSEVSLLANDPDCKFQSIWKLDNLNYQGYNRLALKGNFRTWLSSLDVVNGTYGLILYVVSKETSYNGNDFERTYKFDLSSNDMYGNPFNFETYYLQEKVFDISNIPDIISMELVFYQNGDFLTTDTVLADYKDENGVKYPHNLFVQTPYISLGYELDDVVEDEVKLYTLDAVTYDATYEELTRQKTLNVRWIHIQDDGSIIAIDQEDEIPSNAEIRWYKYNLDRAICDKVAGTFWAEIEEARNKFTYTFTPDILVGSEKYKVIIECPSRDSVYESLIDTIETIGDNELIDPSTNKALTDSETGEVLLESQIVNLAAKSYTDNSLKSFQEYKQIIEDYNDAWKVTHSNENYPNYENVILALDTIYQAQSDVQLYRSEIIEFTNESYDPVSAAIDLISGLEILVDAVGYNGTYLIYDESGMITNSAEAFKKRVLTASYSSLITGEEILDKAENIVWYFPLESSMIYPPQQGTEYDEYDIYSVLSDDELATLELPCSYCRIERAIPELIEGEAGEEIARQTEQYFRVKDYYTQTAVNNTIYCTVFKNGRQYKASATLTFGTSGTNGTEATFRLELREVDEINGALVPSNRPATALTIGDTVAVVPRIYNYNNEEITDDYFSKHLVTYSWYGNNKDPDNGVILEAPAANSTNRFALLRTDSGTTIDKCQYYILTASVYWAVVKYEYDSSGNLVLDNENNPVVKETNGDIESRDVQLKTFLPIPVRISNEYTQVVGPTQIIYDSSGTNPTYYKMPFKLYKDGSIVEANWQSACLEYSNNKTKDNANVLKFYPSLDTEGNLTPTNMYLADNNPFAVEAVCGGKIVWTQPILIIKNKYSSAMLNSWDGDFVINKENGTIMGTMFGAGKKDDNNTFTGVLMGDVDKTGGVEVKTGNKTGIGLYGFHRGEQSFGFNVDGTAFIGKAGRGRIEMNGTKGTIQSGSYISPGKSIDKISGAGMKIDLDGTDSTSASLFAYGKGGSFELNTDDQNSPLLKISSGPYTDSGTLFYIGNSENADFYLQSYDYDGESKGTRLNLKTGDYNTYASNGSYVKISPKGTPYFQIYDVGGARDIFYASTNRFYLQSADYDGKIDPITGNFVDNSDSKATQGMFINLRTGALDARIGYIGGWKVTPTTIEANGIKLDSKGSITAKDWSISSDGTIKFSDGSIGPFTVSSSGLAYTSGGVSFTLGTSGINLNGVFTVNLQGHLTATSAKIGNWNVSQGAISGDGGGVALTSSGGITGGGGSYFNLDSKTGKLTVAELEVDTSALFTKSCQVTIEGNVGINTKPSTGYDLYIKGKSYIGGHTIVGTAGAEDAGLTVYGPCVFGNTTDSSVTTKGKLSVEGKTSLGGKVDIVGQISVNGNDTVGCDADTTVTIDIPWSLTDGKMVFRNGLLMSYNGPTETGQKTSKYVEHDSKKSSSSKAGKLCYLDEVVISKANFKIGSSTSSITTSLSGVSGYPTKTGDTATYVVKVPGQSYSGGSVPYSGSVTRYVWTKKSDNSYVGIYTYRPSSSIYDYETVSISYSGEASYDGGTTPTQYVKAEITVKAQESS